MKLISKEKIQATIATVTGYEREDIVLVGIERKVAQAQLEACEKEAEEKVKEIFEEIEIIILRGRCKIYDK